VADILVAVASVASGQEALLRVVILLEASCWEPEVTHLLLSVAALSSWTSEPDPESLGLEVVEAVKDLPRQVPVEVAHQQDAACFHSCTDLMDHQAAAEAVNYLLVPSPVAAAVANLVVVRLLQIPCRHSQVRGALEVVPSP